jgi:hypothetical protein
MTSTIKAIISRSLLSMKNNNLARTISTVPAYTKMLPSYQHSPAQPFKHPCQLIAAYQTLNIYPTYQLVNLPPPTV